MDYTQTVLTAELLRRRNESPVLSSHEEELICMREQTAKAKAGQKNDRFTRIDRSDRESFTWLQRLVLGTGSN